MAFTLTTPRLLADWDSTTGESLKRGDRGVSVVNTDSLCNIGGAKDLAAYTHSSPAAVATAAKAVVTWARQLAQYWPTLNVGPSLVLRLGTIF
jgi:hypothetical protein